MDFRDTLSKKMGMYEIHEILALSEGNSALKQQLFDLIFDSDEQVAFHATWIFCHSSAIENEWLYDKQDQLVNETFRCKHAGKRRQLLHLLYRLPLPDPIRVDFLDFCLDRMISKDELPAVQSLAMKLAYEQCRLIPELLQELKNTLDLMESDLLPASIRATKKNILKAMKTQKSLQVY